MTRQDQLVQDKLAQEYGIQPDKSMKFRVLVQPMGKPRMTQRDKWKGRDVVNRYMAYKDEVRRQVNVPLWHLPTPYKVKACFIMEMPASWSQKKTDIMCGDIHQQKPDIDNLGKAVLDILFRRDEKISSLKLDKYWDALDAKPGLRLEVVW